MTHAPPLPERKHPIRATLRRLIGPVLSIVAIVVLASSIDLRASLAALGNAEPAPIAVALGLVLLQAGVVTLRWRALLPVSVGHVPMTMLLRAVFVGYLGNFVLPARMGELVRAITVSRLARVAMAPVLGSVVLERLIDITVLAAATILAGWVVGAPRWIIEIGVVIIVVASLLALAASIPRVRRAAAELVTTPRGGRADRLRRIVHDVASGAAIHGRAPALAAAMALTAVAWLIEGTVYWLASVSLGITVPLAAAFLVAAGTVLATAVPSAPAYVGTFELAATALAVALGVDPEQALAWALLAHIITVAPLAIGGVVSLVTMHVSLGDLAQGSSTEAPSTVSDGRPAPPG